MKNYHFELIEIFRDYHAKDYHGTDDDMPDAFDDWLSDLTHSEMGAICEFYLNS